MLMGRALSLRLVTHPGPLMWPPPPVGTARATSPRSHTQRGEMGKPPRWEETGRGRKKALQVQSTIRKH